MEIQLSAIEHKTKYVPAFYNNIGDVATFDKKSNNYFFKHIQDILDMQEERLTALVYDCDGKATLYKIKDITPEEIEAAQYLNKIHSEKVNVIEEYLVVEGGSPILLKAMYYFKFRDIGYCFETDLIKIEPESELEPEPENDPVNNPAHYTYGKIEVIEYILDKGLDFCLGNVIKYVSRAGHKNNALEDLQKAAKYLEFKINDLKNQESE